MIYEHSLELAGRTLRVAQTPAAGPPLLLLHGVLRCWQTFLPLLPTLALRRQVTAIDARGHGHSARTPGAYRVVDYVDDVARLLRQHFSEPAVVYGHSLGAMVALGAAAAAPERVRAVILEDPPLETMGARLRGGPFQAYFEAVDRLLPVQGEVTQLARRLAELPAVDPRTGQHVRLAQLRDAAALRFMASCLLRCDGEVLRPVVAGEWLAGFDWRALVARVACPVLLLQGDAASGAMLSDDDAAVCVTALADVTHVRMPGVGHSMHATRPAELMQIVCGFLESIS